MLTLLCILLHSCRWVANARRSITGTPQCEWRITEAQLGELLGEGGRGYLLGPAQYWCGYQWGIIVSKQADKTVRVGLRTYTHTGLPTPPLVSVAFTLSCISGKGSERKRGKAFLVGTSWGWGDFFRVGCVTGVQQLRRFMSNGTLVLKARMSDLD